MKKSTLIAALVLLAGAAFAQQPGQGPGMGQGMGPSIDWKIRTVVVTEYKKVTGTLTLNANTASTVKVDGVDYQLEVPAQTLRNLRTGDTLVIEGTVSTVKSDPKAQPFIQPFKLTVNGKEVSLDRGPRGDNGPGNGNGPRR